MGNTVVLHGRMISTGVAVGRAELRLESASSVPRYRLVDEQDVEREIDAFHRAIRAAEEEAAQDLEWAQGHLPEREAEIFSAQRSVLTDPTLIEWVESRIREERTNAASAVQTRFDEFRQILGQSTSELIRNRIIDVSDAERLILSQLVETTAQPNGRNDDQPRILVTNDPPPSLLARLDPEQVVGIVCERGAGMSHVAVLARALDLPALVQVEGLLAAVRNGDLLAIDAAEGRVTVNPPESDVEKSRAQQRQRRILFPTGATEPRSKRLTSDGVRVKLLGNVASQQGVEAAAEVDADGIGLFRTEFLYLSRNEVLREDELVEEFCKAACSFATDPVDVRLLDVGSDKHLPGFRMAREENPALGLRSMRFLFRHPEFLIPQIRALLQARADGPVRALLPMVADPGELRRVRKLVQECHETLREEGVRHDPDLPVGAMIEHAAGVVLADEIFATADFVSIGTNDLLMYLLAADRGGSEVTDYYDPFHPSVLRVLCQLADLADKHGKPLSICGELAGDPTWAALFVGLGITRLSMAPQWIGAVSKVIQDIDSRTWAVAAREAAELSTSEEVRARVRELTS